MPYNYLMSRSIRAGLKIDINNAVVIIDEAHNVQEAAE